jgi:hypothetical protein
MGPWFFRSHPKNRPIQSPFATHKGCWGPVFARSSRVNITVNAFTQRL